MTSRERMDIAMRLGTPDRVPFMCQLSLGHYFLQSGLDPIDIWHSTEGFAEALILLQQRYGFDGILINLPGRDPNWRHYIDCIEGRDGESLIHWRNGAHTVAPDADLPHVFQSDGHRYFPRFDEIDPDQLFYMEPHDLSGITYPYSWGFESKPAVPGTDFFPPWHYDTIKEVVRRVGDRVSVHAEIFSPFSQFMDMLDCSRGLVAIRRDPAKVNACLAALTAGAIALACGQAAAGAHAVLISSAYAGAGFLGRPQYEQFVLPYERELIAKFKQQFDIPIYTHTCGAIGDRLDLMMETGTNGIDTLDPPPLGTVELAEAVSQTKGKIFLKGNLNPVELLLGTPEQAFAAARQRLEIAAPGGGYILSTACSVSPKTSPVNILKLREAVEQFG